MENFLPWLVIVSGIFWLFGFPAIFREIQDITIRIFSKGVTSEPPTIRPKVKTRDSLNLAFGQQKKALRNPFVMQCIVTLLILAAALYVIVFQDNKNQWASGVIGSIVGFWFKQR